MINKPIKTLISKASIRLFQTNNSAFLAPLLCNLELQVTDEVPTAATNGKQIIINENFFRELNEEERVILLLHETWHVAKLHMLRRENRDMELWNIACDIRINNDLYDEFSGSSKINWNFFIRNKDLDLNKILSEEEIYDILLKEKFKDQSKDNQNPSNSNNDSSESNETKKVTGDLQEPNESNGIQSSEIINKVVNAAQTAKITEGAGSVPGTVQEILDEFLNPVVPWNVLLNKFLTELSEKDYSWKRPNRRFEDIYLPSLESSENGLEHLVFFLDTSGSISDEDVKRFNSEVKYIHDTYKPKKLTVIQFDYSIQNIKDYAEEDVYEKVEVVGRGGTSLREVEEYIRKHKPTCSVIFSDMYCNPMNKVDTPVIFIVSGNSDWTSPFGKVIHI